jgi:hypothetical protein
MKRSLYNLSALVFVAIMFWSCEPGDEPLNEQNINSASSTVETTLDYGEDLPDYLVAWLKNYEVNDINTYTVEFLERKEAADGQSTTFKYKVSGNGETPQLDSFLLEVPECTGGDPLSWTPQNSSKLLSGAIKWNSSVAKDKSQEYSVTYSGIVPIGIIDATVIRGSTEETGKILGPCEGIYTLKGSVFIDANADNIRQNSESGIQNINVELYDNESQLVTTVSTPSDGSYSFRVIEGSYTLEVGDLLNDENYTAGSTSISLDNVIEDISGNNFAYKFQKSNVINDLKSGDFEVNTEPTKFWVNEVRNAGKKNATYSKEQIQEFLVEIESLFLNNPFQFGSDKRANALDILTRPIKTDLDEYLQQLLTAELNVVSGRGVTNLGDKNSDFNLSLLNYAEAVACKAMGNCSAKGTLSSQTTTTKEVSSKSLETSDTELLSSFNGSGGIGN